LHLLRGRPRGQRDDRLPVSKLRQDADWAVRALPRSIRRVPLPDLLVHGTVKAAMGSVAVTFRILPEDAEADLEPVKARVRKTLGGALRDLKEQPVAFGLKAILAIAVVGDAEGGSDRLEQSLAALPGVGSVETVDVTLV